MNDDIHAAAERVRRVQSAVPICDVYASRPRLLGVSIYDLFQQDRKLLADAYVALLDDTEITEEREVNVSDRLQLLIRRHEVLLIEHSTGPISRVIFSSTRLPITTDGAVRALLLAMGVKS